MEYTKYHFNQEEKLMKHYACEESEEHINEHNEFISYLRNLNYGATDSNQKEALADLVKFISA